MKGIDRADQYLSYYSLLRKTVKWPKKVAFWLINCALFNSFRICQKLNPTSKMRYKLQFDAGEIPKRIYTIFKSRQKFEI